MKKTPIKKIGPVGRINQIAAKINRKRFEEQENKICCVSGCTNVAEAPHHRYSRNAIKDKDKKKWLANLINPKNIKWLCNPHHSNRPPGSRLSEELWEDKK